MVNRITTAWEKSQNGSDAGEASYLALRAAAELHLGEQKDALKDLDLLTAKKVAAWAKHLAELRAAVEHDDRAFQYDPGETPAPYLIFELPT